MKRIPKIGGLVLATLLVPAEVWAEVEAPSRVVMPLELTPTRRRGIPLNQQHIVVGAKRDAQARPRVALEEWVYHGTLLQVVGGTALKRPIRGVLYELRSTDPEVPYAWSLCSGTVLGWFRLFTTDAGSNYLGWVCGSSVAFAEVSGGRDRSVALAEFYTAKPQFVAVPVPALVPEVRDWGVSALYLDINIRSIDNREDGNWIVKISRLDSDEVFTLVGKDDNWRRE
jgi:hypothetical protein